MMSFYQLHKFLKVKKFITVILTFIFYCQFLKAQTAPTPISYPRVTGYVGFMHPLVTFNNTGTHKNFDGAYVGGLPAGINIWKSARIGFSMEFVPFIRAAEGD